jgi:hypothetical protein
MHVCMYAQIQKTGLPYFMEMIKNAERMYIHDTLPKTRFMDVYFSFGYSETSSLKNGFEQ